MMDHVNALIAPSAVIADDTQQESPRTAPGRRRKTGALKGQANRFARRAQPEESNSAAPTVLVSHFGALRSAETAAIPTVPEVRISEKVFLSLDEAVAFTGLPRTRLQSLLKKKKLNGVRRGRWYIRRTDLENLPLIHLQE